MRASLAAFVVGVLSVQLLPRLPSAGWLMVALGAALALGRAGRTVPAACLIGCVWALWQGQQGLHARLPLALEDAALQVQGRVLGLVRNDPPRLQFRFAVESVSRARRPLSLSLRQVSLLVTDASLAPQAGERCTLHVRLRRPRGQVNPGGFDHEAWRFATGIDAQGQVIAHPANRCEPAGLMGTTDAARAAIARRITQAVPTPDVAGILAALAVGEQARLSERQWAVLRATGTTHMVSISGLHVSMVALAVWVLLRRVLGALPRVHRAAPGGALLGGWLAAVAYAFLAGWPVPTQRSVLMLAAMGIRRWRGHRLLDADSLLLALALVLAVDPLASLTSSFWLSFGAMGVLVVVGSVYRGARPPVAWLSTHLWLTVLLAPMLATVSPVLAWTSPLANAVLVPPVTWGVVPLVLMGIVCLPWWPVAAQACWRWAGELWLLIWHGLDTLAGHAPGWTAGRVPSVPEALLGTLGLLVLLLPLGRGRYWFALALVGASVCWPLPRPPPGSFEASVLDVGQGLAVAIETHQHLLLFDTGPRTYGGRDAGEEVVLPWLRARGQHRIDRLVVSHADIDHAGGLGALRAAVPIGMEMMSPRQQSERSVRRCVDGERWVWDGVVFEVLHPAADVPATVSDNDASCVLRVAAGGQRLLLTADIEALAETRLLQSPSRLRAEALLVPHHGSMTSSSPAFLDAVRPQVALLSVGHLNRYGQPAPAVLARYAARGIRLYDTRRMGAIRIRVDPAGFDVTGYREQVRRYWHQAAE